MLRQEKNSRNLTRPSNLYGCHSQGHSLIWSRYGLNAGDKGSVPWVRADLQDPTETVKDSIQAAQWAEGAIDILVNNTGYGIVENIIDIQRDYGY